MLVCLTAFLGPNGTPGAWTQPIPVKIVHGQRAGPLDGGDIIRIDFPVTAGRSFEEGHLILSNMSKHDVRVDLVRPGRLTRGLRLLAVRAWLVPKSAHLMLPGTSRKWPLKDPRSRAATPARNFTVPAHRWVQLIFALQAIRPGVSRLDGVHITFNAGGRAYDWTLDHTIVVSARPPKG